MQVESRMGRWRAVLLLAGAVWFVFTAGCGPEDPGDGPSSDAGADGVVDATDAVGCDPSSDATCRCDYQGRPEGVCADQPVTFGGSCAKPDDYEETEESCTDGLDNDCDGDVDCEDSDCTGSSCGIGEDTAKCVGGKCKETVCFDGVDNDQDGTTDCGDPECTGETCAEDADRTCPAPEEWEREESKCDGTDNDCDGVVDEECPCAYDPTEDGDIDTDDSHGQGVCAGQTRDLGGECERPDGFESRTDSETKCDGDDNDCDGVVDEGCECTYDPTETDEIDTDGSYDDGVCTTQTVGTDGACAAPETFEVRTDSESSCDGLDNDCDGDVDEGCGCTYDPTEMMNKDRDGSHVSGVCTNQGTDSDGNCLEPSMFESRTSSESNCDGMDNDCDGATDEGCGCTHDPTESGDADTDGSHDTGVCPGQTRDASGDCPAPADFESRTDSENACDGVDNDCDGITDEGCGCIYDPDETDNIDTDNSHDSGVCTGASSDNSGVCQQPSGFESRTDTESACDRTDNDCDGAVDEGCSCTYDPGETDNVDNDGSNSDGVCPGQTQDSNGICPQPSRFEDPEQASCDDGVDNDCDGDTDESAGTRGAGDSCTNDCECSTGQCVNGSCPHRIFFTSKTRDGNFGGLSGMDTFCSNVAANASLGGTWKAVASDSGTTAKSRLSISAAVYNMNGDKVADGRSDLWNGSIDNDVKYDENGNSGKVGVWTGTKADGTTAGDHCSDWTSNDTANNGMSGTSDFNGGAWVENVVASCDLGYRVYCIDGQ